MNASWNAVCFLIIDRQLNIIIHFIFFLVIFISVL